MTELSVLNSFHMMSMLFPSSSIFIILCVIFPISAFILLELDQINVRLSITEVRHYHAAVSILENSTVKHIQVPCWYLTSLGLHSFSVSIVTITPHINVCSTIGVSVVLQLFLILFLVIRTNLHPSLSSLHTEKKNVEKHDSCSFFTFTLRSSTGFYMGKESMFFLHFCSKQFAAQDAVGWQDGLLFMSVPCNFFLPKTNQGVAMTFCMVEALTVLWSTVHVLFFASGAVLAKLNLKCYFDNLAVFSCKWHLDANHAFVRFSVWTLMSHT